ncbi:uncharacterized protein YjdB [Clostridium acetobutylicum]|uniref:Protein containing ChW-repeats n=1 Tax=Clostridium acetobutylicum (strain ATCC 824 / DSM 792 / JCM 1419 / IAM 19013 / LMG 5710 / NBRC 13948 / NRRL B-527 / VKM B-1787 / 2291 / W) TaxID=272562 RepID=Q97FZ0_CLOAB|nr:MULTISPECIES: hypothetical protein [Clostridium]AAK80533.1 Protein containing ChW-repeats [Clostridium acetobutylicum ATCC 824]ADZ21632.1 Protein containing ChW-repeats [Clostridium acetobutylicum EA 2018]AEI32447.1 ChW repeat-containing protein [Clostridium acetobutylicum DSM 1731]AWV79049.1 hypothetical protein DK921_02835 [Clostridium acetobutylicum]MBC2394990.1 hypothetical protein [Clostridium acetobutylicum]
MKSNKIIGFIAAAAFVFILGMPTDKSYKADTELGVSYATHVENIGWQGAVENGQEAGTDGKGLRIEALKLNLTNAPEGAHIQYQGHVQNIGWQDWKQDGEEAGTDGKGLRVEALRIKLKNMPGYSVQYRAHVQNIGWQDWVSDGQEAGTDGKGFRIEALEVKIVKVSDNSTVGVSYAGHVQNVGWQDAVENGQISGTEGKGLRVEALKLNLTNAPEGAHIKYQGHVENIGWQEAVQDGEEAGTDGRGFRVEAIKIALENLPGYSVQYRAHVQNIGWQDWVSDGQEAGTDGKGLRIEAIEVRIVKTADGSTPKPVDFIDYSNIPQPAFDKDKTKMDWNSSDKLNQEVNKIENPTGIIYAYNDAGDKITGNVFDAIDLQGNYVADREATEEQAKNNLIKLYDYNNGGLYTAQNGTVYKVAGVYKEYTSTKSNDIDTLKKAVKKLNTQFMTSGYDQSKTFDRLYVVTDGTGTFWINRVVVYLTK